MPLVLGGDHSIALGTLGGLARAAGPGGVLWIDAHADLNTPETTPTGNVHGMALAAALGVAGDRRSRSDALAAARGRAGRVALIGIRSLDEGERELLGAARRAGLHDERPRPHGRRDGDEGGDRARQRRHAVHVSFDMDVVDPEVAPGVGTPVRGGLSYREAHLVMEMIAESGLLTSLEVVEVNPSSTRRTAPPEMAVELIA